MNQTNHFFDIGYGWLCKHCSAADAERKHQHAEGRGDFSNHSNSGGSSGLALAGWTDSSRHALTCPRCGIEETISNA